MSTMVTVGQLRLISKAAKANTENMRSIVVSLDQYGERFGLNLAHRLSHYVSQLAHESGSFNYDKEIWGNTPAQQKYDTRKDLGNTPEVDGDGKKYMGRTAMMLTGKANYAAFYKWCVSEGMNPPDFVDKPELVNTDPWEGLVPIWFWSVGNRTGKSLNIYADKNDLEMITRIINGGTNGLSDRIDYYVRTALVFLDYSVAKDKIEESIKTFQRKYKLEADGVAGPMTRAKFHEVLALTDRKEIASDPSVTVTAAPVVAEKQVAVAPKEAEQPGKDYFAIGTTVVTGGGLTFIKDLAMPVQILLIVVAVAAAGYLLWSRRQIAAKTTEAKEQVKKENTDGLVA